MKAANYSINIHWDRRYPKAGTVDLCPIQLSVNLNGLQFKISLKLYATREDFDKAMSGKGGGNEVKELRQEINKYYCKADEILKRLPDPTREIFQRVFKSETDLFLNNKTAIDLHFQLYIEKLEEEERIGTASSYKTSLNSLLAFRPKLCFEDIDEAWLKSYCNWMTAKGNSMTTCQMYLRNLRAIFNKVIKEGYIAKRLYPFSDFVIGTSVKSKKVLYPEHIEKLWNYKPETLRERRAKAYFMFSYLMNGANFKDVCYLKQSSIQGNTIVFVREKTKRTNRVSGKEIRAFLHPAMKQIIEEWGSKNTGPDDFVFPVLTNDMDADRKERRRDRIQNQVNDKLKIIGQRLGFEVPLLLNLARHSFSTNLKLNGTPVAFISDALGHADMATTAHYMKTIPDKQMKEMSQSLLSF